MQKQKWKEKKGKNQIDQISTSVPPVLNFAC